MSGSEPEGGQEYDAADQSTTVEAAGLITNGSIEPNPQETNLAHEIGDAESTFSTNLSTSELTITNLLTSHSTSVQLDDLTKADIPLRFIITEEQPDQYAVDSVTGTLVPIEEEVGENVAAPAASQSRVGRMPHEASKIVVSSYQVQTLNTKGSLVPSIIHNIPMDTIIDANTSVQIVKNAPGQQQVKADLTKASVVSNLDGPMTLTFTPITSKTAQHSSDIDEIAVNVQQQVAIPKRKARLVADNSAGVKKTIMEMLPNVDMGHIMKLPVVTLPTNAAATKATQQVVTSDPNSATTTLFTSADSSAATSSFVISQPLLRKNAATILGPPIAKDTVLYPIDIQKLSKLSNLSGKSPLVFAGGQKPTYISANILSMIAPDAKKSELQQVMSPGVSGDEAGILMNQQTQQFSSDEFAVEIIEQVSNEMKAQLGDEKGVVSFGESINTVGSQIPEDNMQQYRTIVPKPQLIKKLRNQLKSPSHSRSYSPGGSRTRLRPWLEHLLDAEAIEGLNWVDREERIFRIPWKHASEGSWHAEDSVVFREYAIHSGKHPQNYPTTPQLHTKWKANFRCALNSLSDIVLLREISNPRGQKAYRIYKFLEHKPKKDPGKKRDSFTYVKGSNGDVNREQTDDLSTFTSQDAGELLVALKHGAKNLNLPADFNIGSSLAHGVKLVHRPEGEVVVSIDADTGQQRDVVFPQFHKIGDEYGGPGELIEVSKEVVIPMEGSADESDETDSVRWSLPSEKDIKDLIARATKAAQKRRSGSKGAGKDCDFTAADPGGEVGIAENAIDVIKAEIFFLNTLPEAVSPLALKLAATSLEPDSGGGETSLTWQLKSQFLFKFESIAGTELWTALLWCVICGECFTSLSSLRRHVSVHQEKRLWIDEQLTPAGSAPATNSDCLVCGLRFAKTTSMMKHLLQHSSTFTAAAARSSDSDTDLKCPPCVVCAKPFINLDKLTCHQLSHSCPVCHATAADIDKHVGKCHTAGGLYQCYVCGQYASSLQHMLYHQHEAHLGVYSVDLHNRARQSWIAYCSHCHHLVRAHTGKDKDTTCEECARHHCSGCGRSFKSYLFFLMHTLKEDHDGECVACAYKRVLETRHVSSFYRRSGPVDGQDSSTLHQFADVALGEHIIESGTPAGRDAGSGSDTPATKTAGGRKRTLKGGKAMKHELGEIDLSTLRCAENEVSSTEPNEYSSSPAQYGEVFILQQNAEDTDWMTVESTIVAESPVKRDGPSGKNSSDSERSPRKVPRILATKRRTAARTARAADKKPKVVEENNVLECSVCTEVFPTVRSLRRHKLQEHK